MLAAAAFATFVLRELLFGLLLLGPLIGYGVWLWGQFEIYKKEFKPRIMGLLLDFIDNDPNFGQLSYSENEGVSPKVFFQSMLFECKPIQFVSEDRIIGKIREMDFAICELDVRELSAVRSELDIVFRGIFLVAEYNFPISGRILMLPDAQRQFTQRSAKKFVVTGGRRVEKNLLPEFEAVFDTWATLDANVAKTLSPDMQRAILEFRKKTNREIFVSLIGSILFVAVQQEKDLFEPPVFQNIVSYDMVREHFEDLNLLFSIIEDVDALN